MILLNDSKDNNDGLNNVQDTGAGLVAAALISIVPGYISRSVAGSYDNEGTLFGDTSLLGGVTYPTSSDVLSLLL